MTVSATTSGVEGKANLHTMMQTEPAPDGEVVSYMRRTGPQIKATEQAPPRQLRTHNVCNKTDEIIELQSCKILGEGARWFEPPLGRIYPGEMAQWSTVSPPDTGCELLYRTRDSRSKIVLRAGERTMGLIHGLHEEMPQLLLPPQRPEMAHEWEIWRDRVEQPKARTSPSAVSSSE